ncbi:MAG: BatA domain-containing protein [Gemmatimonadetes bacterium]|nr:BatA domain-containing protein [Gemmatimonadota bacterium]
MSVLVPWLLGAGELAVAGIVALHLLARDEPERWLLPTARFVPESRERAPSRSLRLSDRALLALRAVALAAIALAGAGPWWRGARVPVRRVLIADLSRGSDDPAAVIAAVMRVAAQGDRVVVLDTVARVVSLEALGQAGAAHLPPARLSAALLRAREEARALARDADSVALVLVSPLVADEADDALAAVRATWPGGVTVERVGALAARSERGGARVALRADASDPLRATLGLDGRLGGNEGIGAGPTPPRVVRDVALTAADSAFARAGGVLVHWPAQLAATDTVGAVSGARAVFVASLPRARLDRSGRAVLRWIDGTAAAYERDLGAGCVRDVALPVVSNGDAALRASFRAVVAELLAPCGGFVDRRALDDSTVRALAGPAHAAASAALLAPSADPWLVRALLLLALAALGAEWWLRRRQEAA